MPVSKDFANFETNFADFESLLPFFAYFETTIAYFESLQGYDFGVTSICFTRPTGASRQLHSGLCAA